MFDVIHIVLVFPQAIFDGGAVGVLDLRPAGDAGLDDVPKFVVRNGRFEHFDENGPLGTGTDERHFAPQHVEQLGNFVNAGLANEVAHLGGTGVIFLRPLRPVGFGVGAHGAKFDDLKLNVVQPQPFLPVKQRPFGFEFDGQGRQEHHGRQGDQQPNGIDNVKKTFGRDLGAVAQNRKRFFVEEIVAVQQADFGVAVFGFQKVHQGHHVDAVFDVL